MTESETKLAEQIDQAVKDYLDLKHRITDLLAEIPKQSPEFEWSRSLHFIACSMVMVDKCVAEQAPTAFLEHLNTHFADLVDGYRAAFGEPKPLNPDDSDSWPDEITETEH